MIFTALLWCAPRRARCADSPPRFDAAVVTMGPGESLFTRFGHTALLITDRRFGTEKLYNFGEFDYAAKDLVRRFLTGRLQYFVSIRAFDPLRRVFENGRRSLTLQTLALTDIEGAWLRKNLDVAVRPENRNYPYHHYRANCCTKVRDLVNAATGGDVFRAAGQESGAFRRLTRRSLDGSPFYQLLFSLILGRSTDRPVSFYDAQYLPAAFEAALDQVIRADGRPLVSAKTVLFPDRTALGRTAVLQSGLIVAVGLLLLFFTASPLVLTRHPGLHAVMFGAALVSVGLVCGALGVLMVILWAYTPLVDLHANENLLVCFPSHLVLVGFGSVVIATRRLTPTVATLLRWYAVFAFVLLGVNLVLKVLPWHQENLCFLCAAMLLWGIVFRVTKAARRRVQP